MKPYFLGHHSKYLDCGVRELATEMALRGLPPWVAPDGGFHLGDPQRDEARRVIREDVDGVILYATPGVLESDFVREVELPEAIRRWRSERSLWRRVRRSQGGFLLTAVLNGVTIGELSDETRRHLGYDLTEETCFVLGRDGDARAAARRLLEQRLAVARYRGGEAAFQFSTRERFPDEPEDLLRIDGRDLLLREPAAWPRLAAALGEVKAALSIGRTRRVRVHGSRHLSASFILGRTFPRSGGYSLRVRTRTGWWDTTGPLTGAAMTVTAPSAAPAASVTVVVNATDKDVLGPVERWRQEHGDASPLASVSVKGRTSMDDRQARLIAAEVRSLTSATLAASGAQSLKLFLAAPQGLAVLIGHEWNARPRTTLYEFSEGAYVESLTV